MDADRDRNRNQESSYRVGVDMSRRYPPIPVVTVIVLTTLLATAGCGPRPDQPAPPASTAGRTVTVQRTGGIAGGRDTTVVQPTGEWARTDRTGTRRTGRLTGDQQRELHRLLADPRLPAEAGRSRAPTACRDAFEYLVTIGTMQIGYADCPSDAGQPVAAMAITALVESAAHR